MRIISASVAVAATAVMLSSVASPALAKNKGGNDFGNAITKLFEGFGDFGGGKKGGPSFGGPSNNSNGFNFGGYGGGNGHSKKGQKSYTDNPGTAATPGTNTIVYFGTCLNLAGFQQAGNAGPDGYCLPFESIVGAEANPGSGASCTVTTTSKTRTGGSEGGSSSRGFGYQGGGNWTTTSSSETYAGTCAAYQAANPPKHKDWKGDEESPYEGNID